MKSFFPHFYKITQCDGGFWDFYFIDEEQNIIFYLHYSGEIQIITLNKKVDKKFLQEIMNTGFIDSMRANFDRI